MPRAKLSSTKKQKAVIYCRVSGKKQVSEGSGLDSQEYRCRQYADEKGYEVCEVFPDDITGEGDFMKREGMVALLNYLDSYPRENFVVIFDDLKRYARDAEFHLRLRRLMAERGAKRECLNFPFEDTPEGRFNETINAAVGQLEREQMGRQNRQKSIARIEQGYWVFRAPVGYRYEKAAAGGKELVIDEPLASIIREALEGFASGHLASQTEVRRYLESDPRYPKDMPNGRIRPQTIVRLLGKIVYAGYVEAPKWGIAARKGKHPPIISFDTYRKIQERLKKGVYAPTRKDTRSDFPLRGAVACSCCNTPLTSGWSNGKCKSYPYYRCNNKACDLYGKSIPRDEMETAFTKLLGELQPMQELTAMVEAMFRKGWEMFSGSNRELEKDIQRRIAETETQITQMVERAVSASNPRVISAYENNIDSLERDKLALLEKLQNPAKTKYTFEQLFEHSMQFISKPL